MNFTSLIRFCYENRVDRIYKSINGKDCAVFWPFSLENGVHFFSFLEKEGAVIRYICHFPGQDLSKRNISKSAELITIDDFLKLAASPNVMFTVQDTWLNSFAFMIESLGVKVIRIPGGDSVGFFQKFIDNLEEIEKHYEAFSWDIESLNSYAGALLEIVSRRVALGHYTNLPQYFLPGFLPNKGDVVIDAGCFDGETAKDFLAYGCRVISFELDIDNFAKCKKLADSHGFTIEPYGLGRSEGTCHYRTSGNGVDSCIDSNGDGVGNIIDLDTYVKKEKIDKVHFIKMDIEGAELDALRGAAKTIVRDKPHLAICAYHKPEDMWILMTYIKSLRPDYQFAFRHHYTDLPKGQAMEIMRNYQVQNFPAVWEKILYAR